MPSPRVVLVLEPRTDPAPVLQAVRRFAPGWETLHLVTLDEAAPALWEAVQREVHGAAGALSAETLFDLARLPEVAAAHAATLVVAGPWPSRSATSRALALQELASPNGVDVLSVGGQVSAAPVRTGLAAVSLHLRSTTLALTTARLREVPDLQRALVFVRGAEPAQLQDLETVLGALLPSLPLELRPATTALAERLPGLGAELLVVATDDLWSPTRTALALRSASALDHAPCPVLLLHHGAGDELLTPSLWATDLLPGTAPQVTVVLERTTLRGRETLAADETFLLVGAEAHGALPHRHGVLDVPRAWLPEGAQRVAFVSTRSPSAVAQARVLEGRRLLLVDARATDEALTALEPFAATHTVVFVRLRAHETLEQTRTRLSAAAPWHTFLLDGSALLDDGGAGDVPEALDGLRLWRLARRLGVEAWPPAPAAVRRAVEGGHRVALQLDNQGERERLLTSFQHARERISAQCYIVDVDEVSVAFIEGLRNAALRGVAVRVLVDALYSRHDVYGTRNPVLARLEDVANVEVRVTHPLEGLPSLVDLKQRNHRKLVVVDGREATLSGRNLGATYYRGFDEATLTPESPYRDVPWFDASAVLEGPLVERVEAAFRSDWQRAGGAPFALSAAPAAGGLRCELVLHEGLVDTATFDTQLELVHGARRALLLVNTFPLSLELQQALRRALSRGVALRFLFGNVRPRWGPEAQPFVGGALRELGDELVRARLDPLLKAGAQGFELGLPHPSLGALWPHVHAKVMVRDDEVLAVGSANLDVTSAYWESEALLLVHDADFTRRALARLDALIATSHPVDPHAPDWLKTAERREWLSRNWPSLVG